MKEMDRYKPDEMYDQSKESSQKILWIFCHNLKPFYYNTNCINRVATEILKPNSLIFADFWSKIY